MPSRTCSRGHEFTGNEPCPKCWPEFRRFELKTKPWLYDGDAAWHFLSLPEKESNVIAERFGSMARGWGSLRVSVTIGSTTWDTSIFADKKRGGYLLPVKAAVRKAEDLKVDKTVAYVVEIKDA